MNIFHQGVKPWIIFLLASYFSVCVVMASEKPDLPAIDKSIPKDLQTATLAMGCFWCPDYTFGAVPGVFRTRVGYCGGSTEQPTYKEIGDHAETIQIDFDPKTISYEQILNIFWKHHEPERKPYSTQYKCVVFYHDDSQKKLALESRDRIAANLDANVLTEILPIAKFYIAEDYHQKYELRGDKALMSEFRAMYPNEIDFINSTAAARVNAFVSGHGDRKTLEAEVDKYGLSEEHEARLLESAKRRSQ